MSLNIYLISFILTILSESFIAETIVPSGQFQLKIIVLVNLVTHPIMSFILLVIYINNIFETILLPLVLLEILVILLEWKLLNFVYRENKNIFNLKLSLGMNLVSLLLGLVII